MTSRGCEPVMPVDDAGCGIDIVIRFDEVITLPEAVRVLVVGHFPELDGGILWQ